MKNKRMEFEDLIMNDLSLMKIIEIKYNKLIQQRMLSNLSLRKREAFQNEINLRTGNLLLDKICRLK